MGKLNGLLQLIRPVNCAMMGFAVVVGASFVEKEIFYIDWFFYGDK
jgi:hypothetical protein